MCTIDRIINTLKLNGYTQVDLAEKLAEYGVTKQTITDWKSGKSNSYYPLMAEIAEFLNTSTDYLLTGRGVNSPEHTNEVSNIPSETKKELLSNEEAAQVLQNILAESKLSNPDGTIRGVSIKVISNFILTNESMLKELIDKNQ